MTDDTSASAGSGAAIAELRAGLRELPGQLTRALRLPIVAPRELGACRRICVTGVGSSAGHARFLAHRLRQGGIPAEWLPLSAFASGLPPGASRDGLVVFSQGLSPNARLALAQAEHWRAAALLSGARDLGEEARDFLTRHEVATIDTGASAERGTLVRLVGPVLAYAAGLRLAAALAPALQVDLSGIASACERALRAGEDDAERRPESCFRGPFMLLAAGLDPITRDNLRLKLAEALLQPVAPVCDLLEFAHGPFQELAGTPATLLVLSEPSQPTPLLREGLGEMIDPLHHLVELPALAPDPLSIFEHEAWLGSFVLRGMEVLGLHPESWPGQDRDAPLYELQELPRPGGPATPIETVPSRAPRRLAMVTWPEVEALVADGVDTAVVPLGSTEQHGPHMPFATDTWIAEALAAGFCERVPEALQLPVLPFGCASEHMAFPGTLDLRASTLEAILEDLLGSVAHHRMRRVFVFTAHGGNVELLRQATPRLARAHPALDTIVFADHRELATRLQAVGRGFGVSPIEAGHHAGQLEASILSALAPGALRREHAEVGFMEPVPDARALFYPSLRDRAANGVVGDPRGATAEHAGPYLEAWIDLLVEHYLAAKKRTWTKGTKKA